MKSILLSKKPEIVANILNGKASILVANKLPTPHKIIFMLRKTDGK